MKKFLLFIFNLYLLQANTLGGTKIAVISDLNGSYGSAKYSRTVRNAVEKIKTLNPDLVLTSGDMVAGQKAGLDYQMMWNSFHQAVTTPLLKAGIPFAVSPGNHDASAYPLFSKERAIFKEQWEKFRPALEYLDDSNYPFYYSFKKNNILFLALDATMPGDFSNKQRNWIESELQKHSHLKFKVALGHLPIFATVEKKSSEVVSDPKLLDIFKQNNLSIYLSGHHHAYYPGVNGGVRHVSQACLGSGPRALIGDDSVSKKSFTYIEFGDDGKISVEAYQAPGFTDLIPKNSLPPEIRHKKGILVRDDLIFGK